MNASFPIVEASWYVVYTKPKQEFRALEQLANQGYACYLPTLEVERVCRAKRKTCVEPLFSRYLFVRLDVGTSNWTAVRSTRGVTDLLKFGGRFATLSDDCIAALRMAPQVRLRDMFAPGQLVAVTSGPFAGFEGIYQTSDGDARALIMIELMNQPQKLSFAMEKLRKAA